MKKIPAIFLILCALAPSLYADYSDGRTQRGFFSRLAIVESRGIANLAAMPLEVPRNMVIEGKKRGWLGIITYAPYLVNNIIFRSVSAVNDIAFFPWIVAFTDDLSPISSGMGLSEYPWQFHEGYF